MIEREVSYVLKALHYGAVDICVGPVWSYAIFSTHAKARAFQNVLAVEVGYFDSRYKADVLSIDGRNRIKFVVGFDQTEIAKLLKRKKQQPTHKRIGRLRLSAR